MCVPLCMCVYVSAKRPEESIGPHGTAVIGGYESSYGCWELNAGPLQEQLVLLTTEPVSYSFFKKIICIILIMCRYVHSIDACFRSELSHRWES